MLNRPLDTNESLFYEMDLKGAACRTAQALRLTGPLTEAVLREAMRRLVVLHPRLGCSIRDSLDGPMWEASGTAPELRLLSASDDAAGLLEGALMGASTYPLWWIEWAPQAEQHVLILVLHHSAADGMTAAYVARDLVNLINDVHAGRPERSAIVDAPPLDEILGPAPWLTRLKHRSKNLVARVHPRQIPALPFDERGAASERATRVMLDTLPAEQVAALRDRARSEKTTVSGAITAAMVTAIAQVGGLANDIEVSTQVSLRPHCTPQLEQDVFGCYGARVLTYHTPGSDFWQLARECSGAIHDAIANGDATIPLKRTQNRAGGFAHGFAQAFASAVANPDTCGRTGPLAISSLGVIPGSDPGAVRFDGFFPAIANHPAGTCMQLSCGTLNGELCCTWMYVTPIVSPARAAAIWAAARALLVAA